MATRKIPRNEWKSFLEGFSGQHRGWLITIEHRESGSGSKVQAQDQPLERIAAERKAAGGDRISIAYGRGPDALALYTISAPVDLRLHQTESGAHQELDIDSADGATTSLRFRSTVLPEMVDGL